MGNFSHTAFKIYYQYITHIIPVMSIALPTQFVASSVMLVIECQNAKLNN